VPLNEKPYDPFALPDTLPRESRFDPLG